VTLTLMRKKQKHALKHRGGHPQDLLGPGSFKIGIAPSLIRHATLSHASFCFALMDGCIHGPLLHEVSNALELGIHPDPVVAEGVFNLLIAVTLKAVRFVTRLLILLEKHQPSRNPPSLRPSSSSLPPSAKNSRSRNDTACTLINVLGGFVLFSEQTGHGLDRPWTTGR
jgi:hypothetical protein